MKEQLASAASSITSAANVNIPTTLNPIKKAESQTNVQEQSTSLSSTTSVGHKRTVSSGNFDYAPSTSPSASAIQSTSTKAKQSQQSTYEPKDIELERNSNEPISPQPGSINLRDSPRNRQDSVTDKRAASTGPNRRQQPQLPNQIIKSVKTTESSVDPYFSSTKTLKNSDSSSGSSKFDGKVEIDPLELDALKDTIEVLKAEVQRLGVFEIKLKNQEKEVGLYLN